MDVPEQESLLDPELIRAYRNTVYAVRGGDPPFVLVPDRVCVELAALMSARAQSCAAFLTAWNPDGLRISVAENETRQDRLVRQVRASGHAVIEGLGSDPDGTWPGEASVLALGLDRTSACEIGRRYAQNAVLWIGPDAIPRLLLLR